MRYLQLRAERKRQGVSLLRLAVLTGIDPANLSRIERGQIPAYPGWKRRIAAALGVEDVDWLFEPVGEVADDGR